MTKLKICLTVDLKDEQDAEMTSVQQFDAKTGDFYLKTQGYLNLLFGSLKPDQTKFTKSGIIKHILDSNHDYPIYDGRFSIQGVTKNVDPKL